MSTPPGGTDGTWGPWVPSRRTDSFHTLSMLAVGYGLVGGSRQLATWPEYRTSMGQRFGGNLNVDPFDAREQFGTLQQRNIDGQARYTGGDFPSLYAVRAQAGYSATLRYSALLPDPRGSVDGFEVEGDPRGPLPGTASGDAPPLTLATLVGGSLTLTLAARATEGAARARLWSTPDLFPAAFDFMDYAPATVDPAGWDTLAVASMAEPDYSRAPDVVLPATAPLLSTGVPLAFGIDVLDEPPLLAAPWDGTGEAWFSAPRTTHSGGLFRSTLALELAWPRIRWHYTGAPPVDPGLAPVPVRVRQRDDGLGPSALRARGASSRQRSTRVRGYL